MMTLGLWGIVVLMTLVFVAAFLAVYVFKMELIEYTFGNMDLFWSERAIWGRVRRRRAWKRDKRGKRTHGKKSSGKDQAIETDDAAAKAARWPYE